MITAGRARPGAGPRAVRWTAAPASPAKRPRRLGLLRRDRHLGRHRPRPARPARHAAQPARCAPCAGPAGPAGTTTGGTRPASTRRCTSWPTRSRTAAGPRPSPGPIPAGTRSGFYAARVSSGPHQDFIPLFVRPAAPAARGAADRAHRHLRGVRQLPVLVGEPDPGDGPGPPGRDRCGGAVPHRPSRARRVQLRLPPGRHRRLLRVAAAAQPEHAPRPRPPRGLHLRPGPGRLAGPARTCRTTW